MNSQSIRVFGDLVRSVAVDNPHKPALVFDGRPITFADVNARMNRLADALTARGLRQGDRVAVLTRNRPEAVEVYGAAKAGIAVLPLNWRLSPAELLHPLTDGAPAAIIAEPGFVAAVDELRQQVPSLRHFISLGGATQPLWQDYEALLAQASSYEPTTAVSPDDLLCLMYTSGTTGRPKGAMLTHGGLLRNCRAAADEMLGLREDDVALAAMPLFHVGGMWYHLIPAYARGCTTYVLPEFSAEDVLASIQKNAITYAHFVPTMINALIHHPAVTHTDLSRLRLIYYAASSMPVDLLRKAMATFPQCEFLQGYGSTEGGMITALKAQDHRNALKSSEAAARLATCGTPLHCELRIIAPDKDGIGEIAVKSDRTMSGYWRNDAATEAAMASGWFLTGDLGRIDDHGYLSVADRKNDMIVSGGENVYPREVEDALYRDPDVLEAAVFGLPDPHWVEKVAAAVVLKPSATATADDLRARLRQRLAGYKCPKSIFLCASLPKNGTGKIVKKELRSLFADS